MKWCSMVCLTVLLLSSCRQEGRPVVQPHSERDTLKYLVSKADLIVVVDIADSFDASKAPRWNLPESVKASIVRVLSGNEKPGNTITISRFPSVLPAGSSRAIMALGNGRHLAFLKFNGELYTPLTVDSVIGQRDGRIGVIWRRDPDTTRVRFSDLITFQQVIDDVVNAIENTKTPNK